MAKYFRQRPRFPKPCLSIFLVCSLVACSETAQPLLEPALVGHWEGGFLLHGDSWIANPTPVLLELYDDNAASLGGLKGSWSLADISRWVVRIDIPGRYETRSYELKLDMESDKPGRQLSGNMRYSGSTLKFVQRERGGAFGLAEKLSRLEEAQARQSAENVRRQNGWRRKFYTALHCINYGSSHGVSCG